MAKVITDILIYESGDGGEFQLVNGDLNTVQSITNCVYLALFGGNIEQDTSNSIEDNEQRSDWWGNLLLSDIPYNSEFERTLLNVSLNSSGISKLENAAKNDLKFLKDYANISVNISIDDIDKMSLVVSLQEPDNTERKIKFIWDQLTNEVIQEITI